MKLYAPGSIYDDIKKRGDAPAFWLAMIGLVFVPIALMLG